MWFIYTKIAPVSSQGNLAMRVSDDRYSRDRMRFDLALRLIGTLPLSVLREMRADGALDARVLTHVREEIVRRESRE